MDNILEIRDYNDFILESFDIDHDNKFLEEVIQEATTNVTKENIFQKIWNSIKVIFGWIAKKFGEFVNWIKSLFNKKKQSAEGLLMEMGIKPSSKNNKVIKESSEVINGLMKSVDKKFFFTLDRGDIFRIYQYSEDNKTSDIEVEWNVLQLLFMNRRNDYLQLLVDTLDDFNETNNIEKLKENYRKILNMFEDTMDDLDYDKDKTPYIYMDFVTLQLMSDKILSLNTKLVRIENIKRDLSNIDANVIKMLNYIQRRVMNTQGALNELFKSVEFYYQLSSNYSNTISDLNTLEEFTIRMIKNGYPGLNIIKNVISVSSEKFSNADAVNKGAGRFVLFPESDDSVVWKFAYNGFGIKSNINECDVFIFNKKNGDKLPLVKIKATTKYRVILTMEKMVGGEKLTDEEIDDFKNQIQNLDLIPNRYVSDLHSSNVKKFNGKPKIIDYGYIKFK